MRPPDPRRHHDDAGADGRAYVESEQGAREPADLLAEETGDATLALTAARNALVEERRRLDAGETADEAAADAAERVHRAPTAPST